MITTKRTQPGRLLQEHLGLQVYEIKTVLSGWHVEVDLDQITAVFTGQSVALRLVHGCCDKQEDVMAQPQVAQVVMSREDFQTVLASYRAYERAEKKRFVSCSVPSGSAPADDYDPFLDSDEMP
jgi:hypothetical protein